MKLNRNLTGVFTAISLLPITGCDVKPATTSTPTTSLSVKEVDYATDVVEFDGCQYIRSQGYYGYTFCHKGNCKNPLHKENR